MSRGEDQPVGLQARLERSRAGRVLISLLVVAIVAVVLVWNLPSSDLRNRLMPAVRPVADVTGLDQNWKVFAPNPRRITLALEAVVVYPDGEQVVWRPPDDVEPLFTPYRVYRWRKWVEHARSDDNRARLWLPTARWVAREHAEPGRFPEVVHLVRRWYDLTPPGRPAGEPSWNEFRYYTAEFDAAGEVVSTESHA